MLLGMVIVLIISFRLKGIYNLRDETLVELLFFVIPVLAVIGAILSILIYRIMINKIESSHSLESKLNVYAQAILFRLMALEGSAILSTLAYFLTGHYVFLCIIGIIMGIYIISRPCRSEMISDMKIDPDQFDLITPYK